MIIADRELAGPHGALTVRVYEPSTPTGPGLVWLHGGAFAGGDLDMPEADAVGRAFAERGIAVVSVDYRRAPLSAAWAAEAGLEPHDGVHYPVASEEAAFAYAWAAASDIVTGSWALGGASAGGNLAAGATLRLVHGTGPAPALVVLAYPTLHAVQDAPDAALRAALDAHPDADRFGPESVRGMYENYLGGSVDGAEIFAIPGTATVEDLAGFPPTIMINGDVDELRVSGEGFAAALRSAGVEIDASLEPDTIHGHLNRPDEPGFAASLDRFAARLLSLSTPVNEGLHA